jgi:hypothetical protein
MSIRSLQFHRHTCPLCDARMPLVRRDPHPTLGGNTERLTFECLNCREQQTYAERVEAPATRYSLAIASNRAWGSLHGGA